VLAPTAAAGFPASSRPTWPGDLLARLSLLWRYFIFRFGKRRPVPVFIFLEKAWTVPPQLVPEELYCQFSEAFGELDPERLHRCNHEGDYGNQQF